MPKLLSPDYGCERFRKRTFLWAFFFSPFPLNSSFCAVAFAADSESISGHHYHHTTITQPWSHHQCTNMVIINNIIVSALKKRSPIVFQSFLLLTTSCIDFGINLFLPDIRALLELSGILIYIHIVFHIDSCLSVVAGHLIYQLVRSVDQPCVNATFRFVINSLLTQSRCLVCEFTFNKLKCDFNLIAWRQLLPRTRLAVQALHALAPDIYFF